MVEEERRLAKPAVGDVCGKAAIFNRYEKLILAYFWFFSSLFLLFAIFLPLISFLNSISFSNSFALWFSTLFSLFSTFPLSFYMLFNFLIAMAKLNVSGRKYRNVTRVYKSEIGVYYLEGKRKEIKQEHVGLIEKNKKIFL